MTSSNNLSNKEKAMMTYELILKKRKREQDKKDKMIQDTQIRLVDGCMKRSAYCATRKYNSRIGQI